MRDGSDIEALLDSLETLVDEAEGTKGKWKDVWSEIKNIGQAFKDSMFPTAQDRQAAWTRFQSIIAKVKAGQERAKEIVEARVRESKSHLEQILSYAERAAPSSGSGDAVLAVFTGGLSILIEEGIGAILGPFDDRKFELLKCNEAMKEGWAYLSKNKAAMFGDHKQEAYDALKSASDRLTAAWDMWRSERQGAIDQFHAEKQAAWEARQAKREAWEIRMRDNISQLEDRIDRLESALDHRQSNLSKLEDMRDSTWSDSYRDRVDDWISDEHERIADIEKKIDQIKGWISDTEMKLR
jgi:conjugal transfer/entry exclusion protein